MVLGAAGAQITSTFSAKSLSARRDNGDGGSRDGRFCALEAGRKKNRGHRHSDEWGMAYSGAGIARLKDAHRSHHRLSSFAAADRRYLPGSAIKQTQPDVVLAFLYPVKSRSTSPRGLQIRSEGYDDWNYGRLY